jgi:outer membrane biosynthesis protein TonB
MSLAKLHGPNTRDCGYIAKRLWVCGLGKGSVDANDVATLLSRQLKSCGFHVDKYVAVDKHQAGLITDMVWAGAFDSPAAAGAAMLEMPQSYARTRPLTKTKPKAKPGPKAKSKPKTKAKAKAKPKPKAKAKPKPKAKSDPWKVWKHCQGAKPMSKAKVHK